MNNMLKNVDIHVYNVFRPFLLLILSEKTKEKSEPQ